MEEVHSAAEAGGCISERALDRVQEKEKMTGTIPRKSYLVCPILSAAANYQRRCMGEVCALWNFCDGYRSTRQEDIEEDYKEARDKRALETDDLSRALKKLGEGYAEQGLREE